MSVAVEEFSAGLVHRYSLAGHLQRRLLTGGVCCALLELAMIFEGAVEARRLPVSKTGVFRTIGRGIQRTYQRAWEAL